MKNKKSVEDCLINFFTSILTSCIVIIIFLKIALFLIRVVFKKIGIVYFLLPA